MHAHILIGRDSSAQAGANDEHDATNEGRDHNAIDSKDIGGHVFSTK